MNFANVITVYLKELRETLRDRRALISMFVVPTVGMPLLFSAIAFIGIKVVKKAQEETPSVMVLGAGSSPAVVAALQANAKLALVPAAGDWRARISAKKLRAAVEIPDDFDARVAAGAQPTVKIFHYDGEIKSGFAVRELRTFFGEYRDRTVAASLDSRGLPGSLIRPFEIRAENVAPPEKVGGNAFGGFLPYVFIILCFTGAMYTAIDVTAGEKERGTMETLLCSPVGRLEIVLGKFLMVLTASLATVVCSVASMLLTLTVGGSLLARASTGAVGAAKAAGAAPTVIPMIDPVGLIGVAFLVLPLAVLFASGLLSIALFAKSHKEAQSLISPLIVVIILPAVMGVLPGVELNSKLALVPILNVSLASKELVSGTWPWTHLGLIFLSTSVYAGAAFAWCVRMFNREDVLFRS